MKLIYKYVTPVGPFYIGRSKDGRFHPIFEEQSLGSYGSPAQAADDLGGGHTFSPSAAIDTSTLGISRDVSEWELLRSRKRVQS